MKQSVFFLKYILLLILPMLLFHSCIREEEFDNTPQGNFEALWKIIDEQYCFLDYKQIDWDAIRDKYQPLITPDMSNDGLFEVLGNMLAELKDGHVNLYSASNTARYWDWYLDYPRNYDESLVERYLGRDYRISAGLKYTILDDNIGYISFSDGIGEGNLDETLSYLAACNGLIIDVRNNGGGNLTYTMNPLGDVRLSGKYVLSGGSVRYNPPVISQKIFKITPDSYVEWIGDIADPAFNITAVETVRANVSSDGQDSRPVNFDISINIRNSLNDLAISFGLAAPEDLAMQNQLNSLTAEQRANQAMNLLIYNTYTGPGTTAKVSSENPLNTFIQKELNQWAQNNLKGVDLSFGIDSHGEDDPNGQRTDYSYRLSKNLFNNRVRAVIGGKFSTDADPSQNLKENLIDDISLEYMLTKRDNMYLKVFRHTGYESILEGEITETGVGFVIRKKLSRLGDLFKPMRPKTKKPRK